MRRQNLFRWSGLALCVGMAGLACSKEPSPARPAALAPSPAPAAAPAPNPVAAEPPRVSAANEAALRGALGMASPGSTAVSALPDDVDDSQKIAGKIVLPAAFRTKVKRGDVLFLAARRVGGPSGPGAMLAVQKLTADDFPMAFALSSRDAMIPGVPFEGLMTITVRADKDGDAMTRSKGDVYGQARNVKVGSQSVVVSLDHVQAEDQTLGGTTAMMPGGSGPPHP